DDAIVASLVAMARELRLRVTAEGVESPAVLERLRALGCDQVQGFHVLRPLDADAFAAWLAAPSEALAS
ncbi:MAG: EAL domain-containing protein, partial [Actinobacteria bacterium]|nr:EAL domain-containing protein [Actinomycetota bacterium]